MDALKAVELKMRQAGLDCTAIRAFRHNYLALVSGETGMIPEKSITPVGQLPCLEDIRVKISRSREAELMAQTAVIKLNGGLGTGMGLDKAKSLIPVKNGWNFLDFAVRQILQLRESHQIPLRFLLLNSYSTSEDTLEYLQAYPDLAGDLPLEFLQSRVPKLCVDTFKPVQWPRQPDLEWCPPGHGDIYQMLSATGLLENMERKGVRYLFISNADNLGASLDLALLDYFAESDAPFLMEVAERTTSDKKGGHLARRAGSGRLLLRESAQCPEADEASFQDTARHHYFNTNNLWLRVDRLREELDKNSGILALPLIRNIKTVDPRDKHSPRVFQLETAMGAAIELFDGAAALKVPRSRFAPVKSTADLLSLRSDAYEIQSDFTLRLTPERHGVPPMVVLEDSHYKVMHDFEKAFGRFVPSLLKCKSLKLSGAIECGSGVTVEGDVEVLNTGSERKTWPAGVYRDQKTVL